MKLQIVYDDGTVAMFPAGGSIETELVEMITEAIVSKNVGILRTKKQVGDEARVAIKESIYEFKKNILSVPIKVR